MVKETALRWFGHVLWRGEDTEVGRVSIMEVAGMRRRDRPARRCKDVVENDTRVMGSEKGLMMDRES